MFIKKIAPWLMVIPSAIIGVFVVEVFCWLFLPFTGDSQDKATRRVVFLDGRDPIFRNYEDIFTYAPHNAIRNLTGFFSDSNFNVEYDYHFQTNNFGLAQDSDTVPERDSILLLGDSFTEGQGAEPWFRLVSPEIDKLGYQGINGGFLGTGFEQWLKLERFLIAKHVRIRKLVVLFISDDYQRPVWNLAPAQIQCLAALSLCRAEESYLYRLPPREELAGWVAKIRAARMPIRQQFWLVARAAALLPASYHIYKHFRNQSKNQNSIARSERAERQSRMAISELIGIYGPESVTFIHLPQKDEINGPNELGLKARRAIQEAGGKLFDGFKLCRLTAQDYYSNDDHPNSAGYKKIAVCVNNVLKEVIAGAQ